MSAVMEDHKEKREENLGVSFECYPSVDGRKRTCKERLKGDI